MDIPGFDIPALELTEDQKIEPITVARIRDFHYNVGEDFLDNCEVGHVEAFTAILLERRPELAHYVEEYSIMSIHEFIEIMDIEGILYDEENDVYPIYHDYAAYCNTYLDVLEKVNVILFSVEDYYK